MYKLHISTMTNIASVFKANSMTNLTLDYLRCVMNVRYCEGVRQEVCFQHLDEPDLTAVVFIRQQNQEQTELQTGLTALKNQRQDDFTGEHKFITF